MKLLFALAILSAGALFADGGEWISMFDGKTLDGWKVEVHPESWTVREGALVGDGPKSHLFWMTREFENCEFKADVKISDHGNSGLFFRKGYPGGAKGYEAQVNSTHVDPIKTGSLYKFQDIYEQLVPPETWFNLHIVARGNHIVILVNGKTVVDYVDVKNTFTKGYLALQQHNQGSVVMLKNIMVKPLP